MRQSLGAFLKRLSPLRHEVVFPCLLGGGFFQAGASARPMTIKDGSWFVHFGKIAGITCDRSLGQKLSITPQMLGLCLVGARSARKPVCGKNRVIGSG
jgi:hypothetical protein